MEKTEVKFGWTEAGICKIVEEDEGRMSILLPGRKKPKWVAKSQVQAIPANLRLVKKAKFDQKCGCTSVVDVNGATVEAYNLYGSVTKYVKANVTEGSALTPHHRRVFLEEHGFMRAKGIKSEGKELGPKLFKYMGDGYRVLTPKTEKAEKVVTA